MHFRREKGNSAQTGARIVHFRREKGNSAQTGARIVHFWRKSREYAKCEAGIVHFRREKGIFCKIDINKKDALEWGIGIEMEQISCFVKFYLTETL